MDIRQITIYSESTGSCEGFYKLFHNLLKNNMVYMLAF